ncbi:MAG: cation:proton antiporter [Cyclobacteriaceae bacterium]|nr:cation:proton antiporter [Cyclobacteriaceae bacterium]
MLEHPVFLITLGLILLYGFLSKRLEASMLTAPMVFVTAGVALYFFLPSEVRTNIEAPWVKLVAELTLILVLFVDSSTLDLRELAKHRQLPVRLLLIGLPLTMIAGILLAVPLFPGENIWLIALMALILSPTDAALGLAVVTSERVPMKIRQTINVESGLNDGFALPPILVCLAVLSGTEHSTDGFSYWALFTVKQFVFGPLIGGAVGWIGGALVERTSQKGWMNETFQRLASLSIAVLAYAGAEALQGNGFIAAYFSGMMLGTKTHIFRERIHGFGESLSQVMVLLIFLVTGLIIVPIAYLYWDLNTWIYALLSLTVIRMIPVALSLIGTGLDRKTVTFIGWFGPRGIASVLYLLMAVIQLKLAGHERLFAVIALTVLLSIFLHGMTAVPFSKLFSSPEPATASKE